MSEKKKRLDELLVEQGHIETRSQAKAMIMAGQVLVNNTPITKAGTLIKVDSEIRIKNKLKYVSRGGLKLEKALKEFGVSAKGKVALDIGASTGGFTDCLLQNEAQKVYAVDVGYGQLHWKLQTDDRVILMDRCNFRNIDTSVFNREIEIVVMDVSFISIDKLLPKIEEVLKDSHAQQKRIVSLIKPQFEVGPAYVGKGGVVKDEQVKKDLLKNIIKMFEERAWTDIQTTVSPIKGATGNEEFLLTALYP